MKDLFERLSEASSLEDYEAASKACLDYFPIATESERLEIRKVIIAKGDEIMLKARESRQKAAELIAE